MNYECQCCVQLLSHVVAFARLGIFPMRFSDLFPEEKPAVSVTAAVVLINTLLLEYQ